jgi:cation diffusion facilitator CzcD-associated flavoprotein CzcO
MILVQPQCLLDVLVCATGFDTAHLLSSIAVTGLHERALAQTWQDGPHADYGLPVSAFPNQFQMLGPKTATVRAGRAAGGPQRLPLRLKPAAGRVAPSRHAPHRPFIAPAFPNA